MTADDSKYIIQRGGRFRVEIWHQGVRVSAGSHATLPEAQCARDKKLAELKNEVRQEPGANYPSWVAEGIFAYHPPDEDAAYQRACTEHNLLAVETSKRLSQRIRFNASPVCLVHIADIHFGDAGTDVERAFEEAKWVAEMPNTWAVLVGDPLNQFIALWAQFLALTSHQTIADEWSLLRRYLRILAPKIRINAKGNHDRWQDKYCGFDWFREVFGQLAPNTLYDAYDCRVVIDVCGVEFPMRIRHSWQGTSIYNQTHGIERAARFDTPDFVIGVGAHTHTGGVCRGFNVGQRDCMAVLCGTYKRLDDYVREKGYPQNNNATAVAVILDAETGSMTGVNDLCMASKIMHAFYP